MLVLPGERICWSGYWVDISVFDSDTWRLDVSGDWVDQMNISVFMRVPTMRSGK